MERGAKETRYLIYEFHRGRERKEKKKTRLYQSGTGNLARSHLSRPKRAFQCTIDADVRELT